MNLIPGINGKRIKMPGYCEFPRDLTYVGDCCSNTITIFLKRMQRIEGLEQITAHKSHDGFLEFRINDLLDKEAYKLVVKEDKIFCEASSQEGFSYALVTLFQLVALNGKMIACQQIEDKPNYQWRGFMFDVCRHFFEVEEVEKMIEQCALLKLNRFHWHLSEDQGFRIESKRFPKLNEIGSWRAQTCGDGIRHGGYYTQEEIKRVVNFAKERFVEVIPEIDLPGHTTAMIASYPEYSCSKEETVVAEKFGVLHRILCAGKEEVYTFLDSLLEEICELFPSKYFHIGGDEVVKDEWEQCPDCNRVLEEQNLENYEMLQAYFTERIVNILSKFGKEVIGWNDVLASGRLKQNVIAQYWVEFCPSYSFVEAKKGRRFIMTNFTNFYFDYPGELVPMRAQIDYEPNIKGMPMPKEAEVLGIEAPIWTEGCRTNLELEHMVFPRLLALAERAWCNKTDYQEFIDRANAYHRILESCGIHSATIEEASLSGEKGVEKLIECMKKRRKDEEKEKGINGYASKEELEKAKQLSRDFLKLFMCYSYSDEEIERVVNFMYEP